MLRVNLVNIGSFVLDYSTGITFLYLVKSEVFVLDMLPFSRYIARLVVEMSFEVSKSIYLLSSFSFVTYTFPMVSSFWVVKIFYMVSLSKQITVLSSLELGLRKRALFLM